MKTTTKNVRAIMRKHNSWGIYTNKTKDDTSDNRRVKCYFDENKNLLKDLIREAGAENVKITNGSDFFKRKGIVVKCILS